MKTLFNILVVSSSQHSAQSATTVPSTCDKFKFILKNINKRKSDLNLVWIPHSCHLNTDVLNLNENNYLPSSFCMREGFRLDSGPIFIIIFFKINLNCSKSKETVLAFCAGYWVNETTRISYISFRIWFWTKVQVCLKYKFTQK